jgi:hypothetical protein
LTWKSSLQGEEQKKLDVLSNEVFVKALVSSGRTVRAALPYTSLLDVLTFHTHNKVFNTSPLNLDIDFALAGL